MRLVSNVWVLFLATMLLVACGDDEKDKNGEGSNGNGDDDGLSLKFDGLADFKPTGTPEDFKVSVYKGASVDDESTLEITVKIVCGDNEASKTATAAAGVANFKINDFSKAKFAEVDKDDSCKATATAEGDLSKEHSFKATDASGAASLTIGAGGKITAPTGSKVKISGTSCNAYVVKWTSDTAVTTADKMHTTGLDAGADLYLSGVATGCTLTAGTATLNTFTGYSPATGFAHAETREAGKLALAYQGDKKYNWHVKYEGTDSGVSGFPKGGAVDPAQAASEKEEVENFTTTATDWEVWIKHDGGVQKL